MDNGTWVSNIAETSQANISCHTILALHQKTWRQQILLSFLQYMTLIS